MAFILRRPFAVTAALKTAPRGPSATIRFFHQAPSKTTAFQTRRALPNLTKSSHVFRATFRRTYMQQSYAGPQAGDVKQRLLYGAGIFGATLLGINFVFNRETREDGGMPEYERSYLNGTFMHTGLGIGMIGIAARVLHQNGWSYRLMAANPWVVMGLGLATSVGCMYGTFATSPQNYVQKYVFWSGFNLAQAAVLSPLMFMHPALLARAALYTVGMMGSIAFVGATAKQEKYLYLGGPLLAGVAIVALSGLAPLVVPATAARTLMWTENIWLYGGLAVFGGFTLYDVQKVLYHARMAERGLKERDVVAESVSLELDFLNIFIRMVQILGMQQRRK